MVIELVQWDTSPNLELTCKDDTGEIIDLTDTTEVFFIFRKMGASEMLFKRTVVVQDPPTDGKVALTWEEDDLAVVGHYIGELEINFDDGTKQSSGRLYFKVRAQLDNIPPEGD